MARILLVEDEMLVRELAYEDLVNAGYEVVAAKDGEQAISLLESGKPFDVLFTDIRLPGPADGWQVAEHAKATTPTIKIIFATGMADSERPIAPDANRLQKPYRSEAVLRILREAGIEP